MLRLPPNMQGVSRDMGQYNKVAQEQRENPAAPPPAKLTYTRVIVALHVCAIITHASLAIFVGAHGSAGPQFKLHVTTHAWFNATNSSENTRSAQCGLVNENVKETFTAAGDTFELYPVYEPFGHVDTKALATIWFVLSAVFPLLETVSVVRGASHGGFETWFESDPVFYWRYLEYTVSATVMVIALTALIGVREYFLIFTIAVMNATCMLLGWLADYLRHMESEKVYNADKYWFLKWAPHCLGWVLVIGEWLVPLWAFMRVASGNWLCASEAAQIPEFVVGLIYVTAAVFLSFGGVQTYHLAKEKNATVSKNVFLLYTLLSLFGKSYLGLVLVAQMFV